MSVFGVILLLFVIMILVMYSPVIYQHFVLKQAKNTLMEEIVLLSDFYASRLIVITKRLGEGSSRNSDITFSKAHENQSFAVNSILDLIDELEE